MSILNSVNVSVSNYTMYPYEIRISLTNGTGLSFTTKLPKDLGSHCKEQVDLTPNLPDIFDFDCGHYGDCGYYPDDYITFTDFTIESDVLRLYNKRRYIGIMFPKIDVCIKPDHIECNPQKGNIAIFASILQDSGQ